MRDLLLLMTSFGPRKCPHPLICHYDLAYSIFMVLLSPAAGVAAEKFSILAAFSMLGLLTTAAGLIMFVRRAATTRSLPHEE